MPSPDAVVRTWFEEVWNQGREETIDRLFAASGVAHGLPGGSPLRGPEDFKPFFRSFRGAFPDIHVEVTQTVVEEDRVALHCNVKGTHKGHTLGMPATGKPVEFSGIVIVRIQDGQIVESWNHFDFLGFYQQLGLLPQLPS